MVTEKSYTYSRCLTVAKVTHFSVRNCEFALMLTVYMSYILTCIVLRKKYCECNIPPFFLK